MPTAESPLFDGLTDPQREAVGHIEGPLLVLAGPGSGKTTVVTRRVANLIANGIPPWQILALTFTNKAAGEMRERVEKLLPEDLPGRRGLTLATFHSFCARLLRRYAQPAGLSPRFSIYDSADQRDAMKQALKEAGLDSKNWTPGSVHAAISKAKNHLIDAETYARSAGDFHSRSIAKAYTAYEKIMKRNDALDFDDLLLVTARLLKSPRSGSEFVLRELQSRFQYILIDEYQDTNHAQFVIAHALAASHGNICVVGDPDQSIYGWRGADISNILEFEKQYPRAKVIPLGQNFRSTAHIVAAADTLIRNNRRRKHKPLHTELGEGQKPTVIICLDEHHEAQLILEEFRKRNQPHSEGGTSTPWREMAILYRVNALSRVLEEAFRNASIPYVIARGTAFYERKEVKDALAYLRLLANPSDEVSLRRIINTPTRGIGNATIDKIEIFAINHQMRLFDALRRANEVEGLSPRAVNAIRKFVAMVENWRETARGGRSTNLMPASSVESERGAFAELVERIIRESGLEGMYRHSKSEEDLERLENLAELINAAAEFGPPTSELSASPTADAGEVGDVGGRGGRETASVDGGDRLGTDATLLDTLNSYLESVALVSDADAIDPANGAVTLMTLHAAKGLEFDTVAIAGLEEGLLPHSRAATDDNELEEERRLCFVGITRAKRRLLLSRAANRTHRGLRERTMASQFLQELPPEAVEVIDLAGQQPEGWDDPSDDWASGPAQRTRSGQRSSGSDVEWGRSSWDAADSPRSRRRWGASAGARGGASGGTSGGASGGAGPLIEFPVGCMVNHPKFGLGRVEVVTPRATGSSVQVAFNSVGRKTLILEYAKLERVS